jgi:L-iditol 2-dehydrogenase
VKVLRLHGRADLRLHDEPEPEPSEGEVLLRISTVGLCGSDRHWYAEGEIGDAALTQPLVLGHEFAGTIESGSRAGERVAVDPAIPCGRCELCLGGRQHLCLDVRFAGHGTTDGALRPLLAWPEHLAHRLPDSLSDADGALLEPLGVALHALDLSRIRPGLTAAVFGCGPIGLLLVQLLRLVGTTRVHAADPLPHRAAAAESLGATCARPDGVDVVFDATDVDALDDLLDTVRPGGRVVLVGIPSGDRTSFRASTARRKGLTLAFCRRMQPADLPRAIRLAEAGRVELGSLVSDRYALSEGREAFVALSNRRGLKVIVEPQADVIE